MSPAPIAEHVSVVAVCWAALVAHVVPGVCTVPTAPVASNVKIVAVVIIVRGVS